MYRAVSAIKAGEPVTVALGSGTLRKTERLATSKASDIRVTTIPSELRQRSHDLRNSNQRLVRTKSRSGSARMMTMIQRQNEGV